MGTSSPTAMVLSSCEDQLRVPSSESCRLDLGPTEVPDPAEKATILTEGCS